MPARPRLSPEQWAQIRRVWEGDPRPGYTWIVDYLELDVTSAAVRKKAISEGWEKGEKRSQDNDLQEGKGGLGKSAESAPKKRTPAGKNTGTGKGAAAKKAAPKAGEAGVPKRPRSSATGKGFKKSEGTRRHGSGNHPAPEGFAETKETIAEEDSDALWGGTREIDISRPAVGRPPEYKEEYAKQAYKLCLLGSTDEQLANFFEVSVRTINNWKRWHPEFLHALKSGKTMANAEIAHSLFMRARGMSLPFTHVSTYQGKVTLTELVEHHPPDVAAAKFFLANRDRDNWQFDPEPPPVDPGSLFPSEAEQEAIYQQSREASRKRAENARAARDRLGLFNGANSLPVDTPPHVLREAFGLAGGNGHDEVEDVG